MLTIYRRHRDTCKHKGRRYKGCSCPVWIQGVLEGKAVRRSLDLTSWEAAQLRARELEIHGEGNSLTVKESCVRFMADCEARGIGSAQKGKYKLLTEELKNEFGDWSVRRVTVDDLRKYRESWKLAPVTSLKKLERLRTFFGFCVSSGWIQTNPAKGIKQPTLRQIPTLPYSEAEWNKILSVLETKPKELRALVLLMRYSGLRISDAVSLKRERISDGKLFLYQAKTGHPVQVPLPKIVLDALKECENGEFYFWNGEDKLKSRITDWQEKLKKLFVAASLPNGHSHRLRDTFSVELLNRGVDLLTVSLLLGHQSIKTTQRHYSPFVKSRQDALEAAVKLTW